MPSPFNERPGNRNGTGFRRRAGLESPRRSNRFYIAVGLGVVGATLAARPAYGQTSDPAVVLPPEFSVDPTLLRSWTDVLFGAQDPTPESVIVVTGQAEVEAAPDRARIFLAVETEGPTAREAGEANADRMTSVADAVRAAGASIEGLRVETSGYSLNPVYGPVAERRPREIAGYVARNTLRVTLDAVDGVGGLIDAALAAGSNRVAGLQFEVRDPEPYRSEALRQAIRTARSEAEVMAESLGMSLGPPIEVEGGAAIPSPRPFGQVGPERAFTMAEAAPTPIEAGVQMITARVTIRFRLNSLP